MKNDVSCVDHLPVEFTYDAVELYMTSLSAKLSPIFGSSEKAAGVIEKNVNPDFCLTAFLYMPLT